MNIEGIDVVALACVGVFGTLIYAGHDGAVVGLLASIVGYYFGKKNKTEVIVREVVEDRGSSSSVSDSR